MPQKCIFFGYKLKISARSSQTYSSGKKNNLIRGGGDRNANIYPCRRLKRFISTLLLSFVRTLLYHGEHVFYSYRLYSCHDSFQHVLNFLPYVLLELKMSTLLLSSCTNHSKHGLYSYRLYNMFYFLNSNVLYI